jgi:hypothetical protein
VVLKHSEQLNQGAARIVMNVDGAVRKWDVTLPHGAVPFDNCVEISESKNPAP